METEEVLKAQNEPSKIGVESNIDSPILILLNRHLYECRGDIEDEIFLPQIAPRFGSLTSLETAIFNESVGHLESTSVITKNSVSIIPIARLTAIDFPGVSNLSMLQLISPECDERISRAISPVLSVEPESITKILNFDGG